jgi:phosphoribosylglycinamide formyltransferase 1
LEVKEIYDAGPIVIQKAVSIDGLTSTDEIAKNVLKVEHEIYPIAVKLLVEMRLKVNGRRVEILGEVKN